MHLSTGVVYGNKLSLLLEQVQSRFLSSAAFILKIEHTSRDNLTLKKSDFGFS